MTMQPMTPASGAASTIYVGEIVVGPEQIHGPQGVLPTPGARIELLNATRSVRELPTWALVCTIVGFFFVFLFSLLFLLAREDRIVGHYEVRVVNGDRMLASYIPVSGPSAAWIGLDLAARLTQAREVIAAAS